MCSLVIFEHYCYWSVTKIQFCNYVHYKATFFVLDGPMLPMVQMYVSWYCSQTHYDNAFSNYLKMMVARQLNTNDCENPRSVLETMIDWQK